MARPTGFEPVTSAFGRAAAWPDRCLRDIVNLVSRQGRKDWHSVRKGACVWIFRRREGAAREILSPGDRADPGLASVRDSRQFSERSKSQTRVCLDESELGILH